MPNILHFKSSAVRVSDQVNSYKYLYDPHRFRFLKVVIHSLFEWHVTLSWPAIVYINTGVLFSGPNGGNN